MFPDTVTTPRASLEAGRRGRACDGVVLPQRPVPRSVSVALSPVAEQAILNGASQDELGAERLASWPPA
jgi:hypothetical protein